jgi:hypothetical protein
VPSTATGFFYAPKASGGLGLPRLEHIIKLGTLNNALKFMNSSDPVMSSLIGSGGDRKLKKIVNSLSINWPATLEDINKAKKRLKKEHIKQWTDLKSQGHGVNDFAKERIGNV